MEESLEERTLSDIVERGLGISRGRIDWIGDVGPWMSGPPIGNDLAEMAQTGPMSIPGLSEALQEATAAHLTQARIDLEALGGLPDMVKVMQVFFGRDAVTPEMVSEMTR